MDSAWIQACARPGSQHTGSHRIADDSCCLYCVERGSAGVKCGAQLQHRGTGLTEPRQEAAPCWTHRIPPGGSTVLDSQNPARRQHRAGQTGAGTYHTGGVTLSVSLVSSFLSGGQCDSGYSTQWHTDCTVYLGSQNPTRRQHRAGLTEPRQEAAPCWTHRTPPGGSTVCVFVSLSFLSHQTWMQEW